MRPLILDLFCGAGGAAMGYSRAGFDVIGVDIKPQRSYPFEFIQADALDYLGDWITWHGREYADGFMTSFDAIHASPPCQAFTKARKLQGNTHLDIIGPVRELLIASRLPYVIENVQGSPLIDPVVLCGEMFGLRTYRHRLFEVNFSLDAPIHPDHVKKTTKMGRPPKEGEYMHIVGHFSGADEGRAAMGIPWMSKNELREAIPPAYTEYVGSRLVNHIQRR